MEPLRDDLSLSFLFKTQPHKHTHTQMRVGNSCDELRSHRAALLASDSPAGVELDVGIKQGNNWGSGSPPPAHSGADQTLLLGVPHHLNKSRVFTVGLRHEILQLLLEFTCNTPADRHARGGASISKDFFSERAQGESKLPPTRYRHVLLRWAALHW